MRSVSGQVIPPPPPIPGQVWSEGMEGWGWVLGLGDPLTRLGPGKGWEGKEVNYVNYVIFFRLKVL